MESRCCDKFLSPNRNDAARIAFILNLLSINGLEDVLGTVSWEEMSRSSVIS